MLVEGKCEILEKERQDELLNRSDDDDRVLMLLGSR
jgi:hypothetical protein